MIANSNASTTVIEKKEDHHHHKDGEPDIDIKLPGIEIKSGDDKQQRTSVRASNVRCRSISITTTRRTS